MADQNLAEQVKSDIRTLKTSLRDLQPSVRLTDIRDNLEDLGTSVNTVDQRIKSLRERGYAFEKDLENRALKYSREWSKIAPA